jgi:hypothetical protein
MARETFQTKNRKCSRVGISVKIRPSCPAFFLIADLSFSVVTTLKQLCWLVRTYRVGVAQCQHVVDICCRGRQYKDIDEVEVYRYSLFQSTFFNSRENAPCRNTGHKKEKATTTTTTILYYN